MSDKEKQIEEIEQFIYDYVDSKQTEKVYLFSSRVIELVKVAKPFTHNKGIAEAIYNAGYRKIDENCAVITKAELKEYKRQAVKEFAEHLKEKFGEYEVWHYNGNEEGWHDLKQEIDECVKEFVEKE